MIENFSHYALFIAGGLRLTLTLTFFSLLVGLTGGVVFSTGGPAFPSGGTNIPARFDRAFVVGGIGCDFMPLANLGISTVLNVSYPFIFRPELNLKVAF